VEQGVDMVVSRFTDSRPHCAIRCVSSSWYGRHEQASSRCFQHTSLTSCRARELRIHGCTATTLLPTRFVKVSVADPHMKSASRHTHRRPSPIRKTLHRFVESKRRGHEFWRRASARRGGALLARTLRRRAHQPRACAQGIFGLCLVLTPSRSWAWQAPGVAEGSSRQR